MLVFIDVRKDTEMSVVTSLPHHDLSGFISVGLVAVTVRINNYQQHTVISTMYVDCELVLSCGLSHFSYLCEWLSGVGCINIL